ncbi:MAG: hypothetical protein EWV53_17955 [Microcystis panniformis Mp_MB_F_20051200_S9]|uniref:Uncharacterized protein n=1 Tax=Microcystis panniformis Mp_MB_F_20051200_S9 TaxID=2486223 RepID=A0A552PPK0_9CHRO|nr:MAG: hypothetical protein EWV87_06355 [Microcystis panniformis Mp_GB_SS_20050300_S99]TRV52029.1 MAG: hypothetical protein EWV43_03055 [Microcystis panniformis Mp_MB_F_20080800_S26D]TRV56131.1 MAG: hypothetical protein EWV42_00015 [Microcystis panniformis Mp_GB_SS_20050300_S99D]TRV58913.1 MAG: hypothetical protein EWV53_17955 [Microcystis panniformis Mp_MB_F_20051200_S9]TRV59728.1 MAG: hypothetical protein EWV86_17545 [Microcystis panniformis Mp_MB_F_20051200_S9D]TRV61330.1 MAG: hypothetical
MEILGSLILIFAFFEPSKINYARGLINLNRRSMITDRAYSIVINRSILQRIIEIKNGYSID